MDNKTVLLLIALAAVILAFFVTGHNEGLDETVDCNKNPKAPQCQSPECKSNSDCTDSSKPDCTGGKCVPTPTSESLTTCAPSDGKWAVPVDNGTRTSLNSPCCRPNTGYKVPNSYSTCDSVNTETNVAIQNCLSKCCHYTDAQAADFSNPSWYPMARCACSLWCNNPGAQHLRDYPTAISYIEDGIGHPYATGDPIEGSGAQH